MSPEGGQGSPLPTFIFMGAIFLVMYFFMIRPQTKKAKEQKLFIDEMKKGDKVVTISGMHGKIASIDANTLMLEVDANTRVKLDKTGISMEYTRAAYGNGNEKETKAEKQPAEKS